MLPLFFLLLVSAHGAQRKYDIESDSQKLFGTDLQGALARFRRTQDFARILEDELGNLVTAIKDVSMQGLRFYESEFRVEAEEFALKVPKYKFLILNPDDNVTDVDILDRHLTQYQRTPVKIRNKLRKRGFELASKVIDDCISALAVKNEE